MARTRTTIRRIDPWSILKFAFVANLVLLAIELLVGAFAWMMIRRLELIETVCGLAGKLGVNECAVDGQQLFDTVLVLGLLGVVIQTGVLVFMTFLANLIFDLVGGIVVTLDDEAAPAPVAGGPISSRSASKKKPSLKGSKKTPKKSRPSSLSTMAARKAGSSSSSDAASTTASGSSPMGAGSTSGNAPSTDASSTTTSALGGKSGSGTDTGDSSDSLFGGS